MSENSETSVQAGDESTTESAQDYTAVINQLRAELENERAEKLLVDGKNKELLGEKMAAKEAADKAKRAKQDADRVAAERAGDIAELKRLYEEERQTSDNRLRSLVVDGAIRTAISKNNVRAELAPAVEAYLGRMTDYQNGEALIAGQSIESYTAQWFASDAGRHYVRAAANSGGGASGSNGSQATTWSRAPKTAAEWTAFDKMPLAERQSTAARLGMKDVV